MKTPNFPDIYIAILWVLPPSLLQMWQEIGRCGRDGRSGVAIYYGYARSVLMPCDKCRKERKYHCKCNDHEYLRSAVTVEKEHCQRIHCFKHFLLEGMLHVHVKKNGYGIKVKETPFHLRTELTKNRHLEIATRIFNTVGNPTPYSKS
jgi:superfamily II DNA helicase RecQ